MFDAGALQFKLQTLGAKVFKQDQADAKDAVEKTGKAAQTAKGQIDGLGTATDDAGKKSKGAKAPLDEQAKSTEEVGKRSKKASEEQNKQAASTEQQIEAARKLSFALIAAGTAVAALVSLSVAKSTEFDAAMSNVRAATMATAQEQRALGEAALDAGADTAYSASEAAAAEEELAKAGLSVSEVVGGSLNGALALAAAGQLQVARSAEIMATTLTQFGLTADQSGHVADVLAAGAGKAQGSVDDLALALGYVGPLANQAGWSLEETAGTLAYFATQGVLGEKGGTALRGVLASLQAPSAAADAELKKYNISLYDGTGKMLGAAGVAQQLHTKLGGLTEQERNAALGRIFGNESLVAATLLYRGGAQEVSKWTDNVNDAAYAAEQARIKQDNLAGDIEKLGGAFDTALIKTGSGANDVLRSMVQSLTFLVDAFGEAPEPVQTLTLGIGAAVAAMLLFAGGAVGARAKFLELQETLKGTNMTMGRTAIVGAAAGLALTGIITVVGLLMAAQAEARAKAEAYADTLEEGTHRVTKATREMVTESLAAKGQFLFWEQPSAFDKAEALGLSLDRVTDAAMGNVDALKELKTVQDELQAAYDADKDAGDTTSIDDARLQNINAIIDAVKGENSTIEESIRVAEQQQKALDGTTESSQSATDAYIAQADSVDELNSKLSTLIDRINEANGVGQDANSTNIAMQNTLRDVDEQIHNVQAGLEGYGQGIDAATQAGADNRAMLLGWAEDSQRAADAQLKLDGNTEAYIARLQDGRQKLIDSAVAMGASQEAAEALADQIYQIPSQKEINILADTSAAQGELDRFIRNAIGREVRVKVIADGSGIQIGGKTITAPGQATGGPVYGPGTGTSDDVLRWLSNGEHVLTAREVQAAGGHAAVERWRQELVRGGSHPVLTPEISQKETIIALPKGATTPWMANALYPTIGASV